MTPLRSALKDEFARLDARLADDNWHPTEQDIAQAWHALGHERAARQFELLTKDKPAE